MLLFDTHAHYWDERFAEYEGGAKAAVAEARAAGVRGFINAGSTPESSRLSIELALENDDMYAAVGVHPSDSAELDEGEALSATEELVIDDRERKSGRKLIVAIGEIGLDYHWPDTDRDAQRVWFDAQLDLAARLGLPVIIHDRDAHGDCLDIVRAHPGLRGVFHAFSGSAETARELVRLGFHLGFGGTVTYRNATKLREVVATVPDEYLLIETDAPYLPPVPHRGEINRSALMSYTAKAIAAARGVMPDAIAELTYKNALELFNIQPANA